MNVIDDDTDSRGLVHNSSRGSIGNKTSIITMF